jgi:hypothetical protein
MPAGPDPLGKRALFWMPVGAAAEDPGASGPGGDGAPGGPARHVRPAGRHALFSDATPADEPDRAAATATADDPAHARGLLTVACSRCGGVSQVGLVEFAVLHLPVAAWLPGRRFDRWMTCPACRARAWTSVTRTR